MAVGGLQVAHVRSTSIRVEAGLGGLELHLEDTWHKETCLGMDLLSYISAICKKRKNILTHYKKLQSVQENGIWFLG